MNAVDLAKIWIQKRKPKEVSWGLICGIMSNLLKRFDSRDILDAMTKYIFYYEHGTIKGFALNCPRLIKWKRVKYEPEE